MSKLHSHEERMEREWENSDDTVIFPGSSSVVGLSWRSKDNLAWFSAFDAGSVLAVSGRVPAHPQPFQ
jgi:hypothetical protein